MVATSEPGHADDWADTGPIQMPRVDLTGHPGVSDTFVRPCHDCGTTIRVNAGVEQPHEHHAPTRDDGSPLVYAWWQGYDARDAAPLTGQESAQISTLAGAGAENVSQPTGDADKARGARYAEAMCADGAHHDVDWIPPVAMPGSSNPRLHVAACFACQRAARAVLPLVEAQVAPLRDALARVEALAAEMGKHKAPWWFVDMARDLRDALSGDYDLTGAICCGHDADAHDGSGCIDCPCNKAPFSEGYRPNPVRVEVGENTSRIPADDLRRADLVRAERDADGWAARADAAESALRQVREDLTALADEPHNHGSKDCTTCSRQTRIRAILDSARVGAADTQPEGAGK